LPRRGKLAANLRQNCAKLAANGASKVATNLTHISEKICRNLAASWQGHGKLSRQTGQYLVVKEKER
jgi:hypothetical protein